MTKVSGASGTSGGGADKIRALRASAKDAPPPPPDDVPPGDAGGSGDGHEAPVRFLNEGCPVIALGVNQDCFYYLDQLGQLRDLKAKDHSRLNIMGLFGRLSELLYTYWPRMTPNPSVKGEYHVTGWKPEVAAEKLMGEAALRGVWSPQERVRGSGTWLGDDGELIWHCGDRLIVTPTTEPTPLDPGDADRVPWVEQAPGLVGIRVYPTAPALLRPHEQRQAAGEKGPGMNMLRLLATWSWRRPDVDPYLLLGWIGAAMMGGAIDWRPLAWTTGGSGTGKSTLQKAIKWTMGDNGLLHSPDATAPAVRQTLKFASLPVEIDEAESEEDNRKINTLIKLARDAATGALAIRGGSDHEASAFTVRSCFLFTSILIPPLLPADRNRMAILELGPLGDRAEPKITPRKMAELGRRLQRRLVDNWHRWPATVTAYRNALREAGHKARGQDVFGTLLAAADLLLYDEVPVADALQGWGTKLAADNLAEMEGMIEDQNACLGHLMSTMLESPHDRQRRTVGEWIGRACQRFGADAEGARRANELIQELGIKVVPYEGQTYLAVANMHRGLTRIFADTQWGARPGAMGVWVQALRRLPHQVPKKAIWIGASVKTTLVPIDICLPPRPHQGAASDGSAAGSGAAQDPGELGALGDPALDRAGDADRGVDQAGLDGDPGAGLDPSLDRGSWEIQP